MGVQFVQSPSGGRLIAYVSQHNMYNVFLDTVTEPDCQGSWQCGMRLKALDLSFLVSGCALCRSFLPFRLLDLHILQLAIALEDMEDICAETGRIFGQL